MNLAFRKLALLEQDLIAKEEAEFERGYVSNPADTKFKVKVKKLMDRVREL